MREILFRGKTKDNVWYHGFIKGKSLPNFEGNKLEFTPCIIEQPYADIWVIPETVGQYTDLTDKNGKKIFEGDIVKIYLYEPKGLANYEIGCIKYDDTKARFVFCTEEGNYGIDNSNVFEVIGNIHDNPELLKGGAE